MHLLGHFALGYFSALAVSLVTGEKISILTVFLVSILPDLDFLFRKILIHRGPTHSIVVATLVFTPIILVFKQGLPYLAALLSHSMIGDYIYPPVQLLWPLTKKWFTINKSLRMKESTLRLVEVSIFVLASITILLLSRG